MRAKCGRQSCLQAAFQAAGRAGKPACSQDWLPRNALRASFQLSAIGFQLTGVRLSARLGGLSGRIVAARKDSQV
jgi:hypothetical protein